MTKDEIRRVNQHKGGSTKTKTGRDYILAQAATQLKLMHNVQIRKYADLKTLHLQKLVSGWVKQGLKQRTVNNRLSAIRAALQVSGRSKFAFSEANSNRTLWMHANGLSKPISASRKGTHADIPKEVILERINRLPEPFQTVANLQLELGLRAREAVVCGQSLKTWQKQLKDGRPVTVIFGTKTGKCRDVQILSDEHRQRVSTLVNHALSRLDRPHGNLIEVKGSSKHPAEAAIRQYQRAMNGVGFVRAEASHALRYAWSKEQFSRHLDVTGDSKTALALLSLDLGHGDGRGRYCKSVYLKSDL